MRQRVLPPAQAHLVLLYTRLLTGACFLLGLLGLLQTDLGQHTDVGGAPVLVFRTDLTTSIILTAIALVGLPSAHTAAGARRFLLAAGAVLLPWALAGYVLDGHSSDPFDRNLILVNTQLVAALLALAIALWRRWPTLPPTGEPDGEPPAREP